MTEENKGSDVTMMSYIMCSSGIGMLCHKINVYSVSLVLARISGCHRRSLPVYTERTIYCCTIICHNLLTHWKHGVADVLSFDELTKKQQSPKPQLVIVPRHRLQLMHSQTHSAVDW